MLRLTLRMEFPVKPNPPIEVPMTAWRFNLTGRDGADVGLAVICLQARYCSVQWFEHPRPTRRHVKPTEWRQVETEGYTLALGPLPADSTIAQLVAGDRSRSVTVTYLQILDLRIPVLEMAAVLDGYLDRVPQRTRGGYIPTTHLK
jgi:hypothetical protein